jgi:hypothetical protein
MRAVTPPRCAVVLAALLFAARAQAQTQDTEVPGDPGVSPTPLFPPTPPRATLWGAPASPFGVYRAPRLYAPEVIPTPRPVYTQGMSGVETVALYTTATLWGGGLGLWIAGAAVRDNDGAHTVILPLLGIGAGVAAAVMIDRYAGVRRGRALAVHAGMWLGLTAGIGLVGAGNMSFDRDVVNAAPHTLFLSTTAGMALGAGLAAATDARPGSISFTFSTGFWGAYAGAMIESWARTEGRSRFPAAGILVGEGIGVATGILLSKFIEPTAAQARWMDLGAVSGVSLGVLLGGLAVRDTEAAPFIGSLVGLAGGMALGYVLGRPTEEERRMNRERDGVEGPRISAFVMPVEGGAVAGLSL